MTRKTLWLMVSCLMVVALVLSSCTTAPVEEGETTIIKGKVKEGEEPKEEEPKEEEPKDEVEKPREMYRDPATGEMVEKPEYGGIITRSDTVLNGFDPIPWPQAGPVQVFVFEKALTGDWALDRSKYDFTIAQNSAPLQYSVGAVAETWSFPDPLSIILNIREGVYWHNMPPVDGRELTADDVVWNFERLKASPQSEAIFKEIDTITATDKYTVEIALVPPATVSKALQLLDSESACFVAPESVGPSGKIEEWQKMIGTGPWMLTDVVMGSAIEMKRNPNYWGYDEKNPENRLPYADGVTTLLIQDWGTRLAALRTGKVDFFIQLPYRTKQDLIKSNPELNYVTKPMGSPNVWRMPFYAPPFTDVRVRQALNMAVDRQEVVDSYYGGEAVFYSGLLPPIRPDLYIPYDELPDRIVSDSKYTAKEVLTYNPEEARKILAEAGYPNGFKTELYTTTAGHMVVGFAELLQSYLADIGVETEIKMYEWAAFNSLRYAKSSPGILHHWDAMYTDEFRLASTVADPNHVWNFNLVNDPIFTELFNEAAVTFDEAERVPKVQDMALYALEQGYSIAMPSPMQSNFWQPWIKSCNGEASLGTWNIGPVYARWWVDQDLKQSMGR